MSALFGPEIRRTTLVVITICACGLTAHWALMFWHSAHLRSLAQGLGWPKPQIDALAQHALYLLTIGAIIGNFAAGAVARWIGYRLATVTIMLAYFGLMIFTYGTVREPGSILLMLPFLGAAQGVFALFTMCLPPLFPTLLRTTGAGFCYNIGRIFAAAGTVIFGLFAQVGTGAGAICDHRLALLYAGCLFLPAGIVAWWLPEPDAAPAVRAPMATEAFE